LCVGGPVLNPVTYLQERRKVSDKFDFVLPLKQHTKVFLPSAMSTSAIKEREGNRDSAETEHVITQ
jgi:hypothetical protein